MSDFDTIQVGRGEAFPLGVTKKGDGEIQIAAWHSGIGNCQLRIYSENKTVKKIRMYGREDIGFGDIFSVSLRGEGVAELLQGLEYEFVSDGKVLPDPFARAVSGRDRFGRKGGKVRSRFVLDEFDWTGEDWVRLPARDMVLYQCHVRGFTRHSSSGVKAPGTFAGLREKIPYLKELGVNTLLLLPVYDFDECMRDENGVELGRVNYWGYGGDAYYFAPKASYSSCPENPGAEFKSMIKSLHQNGMNVILDMYFTGLTPEVILECLRYYALQFHVDGFRINQDCMETAWLRRDSVLSHVKIIGNGWADQPGDEGAESLLEMNDGFLVDARRYLKSDEGQTEHFYHRFKEQRRGVGLIHYITQNNGFTLRDLISYDVKHNEDNGEKNADGTQYNYSWNCGFEGPSRCKAVLRTREKQEKNAFVMLLLGMASPMILAGDEFGNSQKGNNNAYCQDNLITWLDWRLLEKNKETFEFVKMLLRFRKNHPLYHSDRMLTGMDSKGLGAPDVSCHGTEPWVADFSYYSRELGIMYYGSYFEDQTLYFAFNFHWDSHDFFLPGIEAGRRWEVAIDTSGQGVGEIVEKKAYKMAPRSIAVFKSGPEQAKKENKKKSRKRASGK